MEFVKVWGLTAAAGAALITNINQYLTAGVLLASLCYTVLKTVKLVKGWNDKRSSSKRDK